MGYVDDAFDKCKSTLKITGSEQAFASRKHNEIRDHVRTQWDLDDDFLTGSYRRDTKTKPLKDVDIFVVISPTGGQAQLRKGSPSQGLSALKQVLSTKYDNVTTDGFACIVSVGADEDVASFDVVPAFKRKGGGWEIADGARGVWISTNPKTHHEQSTSKNAACDAKFVPFVKMIKGINREAGEPISPSFLLEVMAYGIVREPFGRYQDEICWFLATAADQVTNDWPDPAGIGPDVNGQATAAERRAAADVLRGWTRTAEEAVRLEDDGQERAAVEEWRVLFGSRMPRP
jgi:hypothetical protein